MSMYVPSRRGPVMTAAAIAALLLALLAPLLSQPVVRAQTPLQVLSTLDDGSVGTLRHLIETAPPGSTIRFDNLSLPATITLDPTKEYLAINTSLTIEGPGPGNLTISGGNATFVFLVQELTTVTIGGVTISGGKFGLGAGIQNRGDLTIANSVITGNTTDNTGSGNGGGISNNPTGSLTITGGSTISGNTAVGDGGGIHNFGGSVTIAAGSTISGNTALGYGGGIFNAPVLDGPPGEMHITASTISGNTATDNGGGIFTSGDPVTIVNSTISGNGASSGGGLYTPSGSVTITNSTFFNNTAAAGSGILGASNVSLKGTIVASPGTTGSACSALITTAGYTTAVASREALGLPTS